MALSSYRSKGHIPTKAPKLRELEPVGCVVPKSKSEGDSRYRIVRQCVKRVSSYVVVVCSSLPVPRVLKIRAEDSERSSRKPNRVTDIKERVCAKAVPGNGRINTERGSAV